MSPLVAVSLEEFFSLRMLVAAVALPVLTAWLLYLWLRLVRRGRRDARSTESWSSTIGTIVFSKPVWGRPPNPFTRSDADRDTLKSERVGVAYTFEVDGRAYEGDVPTPAELTRRRWGVHRAWRYSRRHPVGSTITVRYDPEDPTRSCADPDTPVPAAG
ncbi:DUF3592 domain-containing protein [Nocardiopsis sp. MG754419]|uniref:DUF3592 domain-containing protein n=1 Tax=Nocardiopsis sp. MG754419 TaxID=2259865 RepID=UPI001BA83A25|nr:DUF3592 domain-containing protein [Nocardiopsis sp. MG754419]